MSDEDLEKTTGDEGFVAPETEQPKNTNFHLVSSDIREVNTPYGTTTDYFYKLYDGNVCVGDVEVKPFKHFQIGGNTFGYRVSIKNESNEYINGFDIESDNKDFMSVLNTQDLEKIETEVDQFMRKS